MATVQQPNGVTDQSGSLRQRSILEKSLLIRGVEQRLLKLFSEGKLFGTVHTCIGQEYVGVAVAGALEQGDLIFSNHRCHGHYLARTDDVLGLIGEIMGRQAGICGGRGGSQHLCSNGFYSNGVQGGIMPVSAGLAYSQNLLGKSNITVVFIGDGTLGEGTVYETMNIASKWNLPLLIVLENNRYAQSTSQSQTLAGEITARATAFGIASARTSTWDLDELVQATSKAVKSVRQERKPYFLQVDTYRLMAHSKSDDDRDPAEVQQYWANDPLVEFESVHASDFAQWIEQRDKRIEEAVSKAEESPCSTPIPDENPQADPASIKWSATCIETSDRMVALIRQSFARNMKRDERIILIGEDIESPYGGAFKVTKGLSDEFPGRVRNTPISEATIVGMGNGMALGGVLPVCEIMFGDFLALAADQLLNHAAKFHYMYNHQVRVPVIVRTPMGGKRGYGPTHSQSIEKHFLGMTQTRMLALHHRCDPGLIYDTLFTTIDRPTVVIENKLLYTVRVTHEAPQGFVLEHTNERFPTTRLRPQGDAQVTVLCYGGMLPDVEQAVQDAFGQHEIICEIICPVQLYPLDMRPILESVSKTHRLVIIEEGIGFAAFGSEVLASIVEQSPGVLHAAKRLASPQHPIPSCGPLEKSVLPNPLSILETIAEVMRHG